MKHRVEPNGRARRVPVVVPLILVVIGLFPTTTPAQIAPGPFADGVPWFTSPLGLGVDKPATPTDKLQVDTDGNGLPDTDFDLPAELVPSADVDFEYRLSPTQNYLYVTKFNVPVGGATSVCGGFPNVEVHLYALDTPPSLAPFTLVDSGGSRCVVGPLSKQPVFYDQSGPLRTMVLVGAADGGGPGLHQVLWADLIGRGLRIDGTMLHNGIGQVAIQFSPSGNAAFVTHGFSTIQKRYTFVDLCQNPLGAVSVTQDLPSGGIPSAQVIDSGSDSLAELLLDGAPELGSQLVLSTACFPAGPIACCRPGIGCTDDLTADECVNDGGAVLDGTCATVECEESCCYEGACVVTPSDDCMSAGGSPQGTFNCAGISCPQPSQACCAPQGFCVDLAPADCMTFYSGTPLGPGTDCFVPTPVTCPVMHLSVTKTGPPQVIEGVPFEYTIEYENDGDLTAPGTLLRDSLSPGFLEFVSASHGGQENSGQVEWNLGDLAVGQSSAVTLEVRAGCDITFVDNGATIESSGVQFFSNRPGSEVLRDAAPIEIQVTATGSNGLPVQGGDLVTFTFSLTNTASTPRTGIGFEIEVAPGLTLESILDDGGGQITVISASRWEWSGDLDPLAAVDVVVTARVPTCVQQTEVKLRRVVVTNSCGRALGRAPHTALPVRRPIEIAIEAINLNPKTTLENSTFAQTFQLLRHGAVIDVRITATNPHAVAIATATITAFLPFGFDPVGNPPFIPPTETGATYNASTRRISWSGALASQQTVTITFRALHLGDSSTASMNGNASVGTCSIFGGYSLTPVPLPPTTPHLVALKNGRLTTYRPGVDTEVQPLFDYPNDFLNGERMARNANGDIWVAGPPIFRFNPETLELEGLPIELVDRLEFLPDDIAFDPVRESVLFIGNRLEPDGELIGLRIASYDPTSGLVSALFDSDGENPISVSSVLDDLLVADPWAQTVFHTGHVLYRFSGGDPDPFPTAPISSIASDGDGSILGVTSLCCPSIREVKDFDSSTGDATVIVDLAPELPPLFTPHSMTLGDQGDIYVSSGSDGLAVVHRQPSLSVDLLLPETATSDALLDILWVSDSCDDGDGDGAGFGVGCAPSQVDCDDENPEVYPGAPEINDGLDNQCPADPGDGVADELAPDSHFVGDDEFHWTPQPGATEYQVVRAPVRDFSSGCTSTITTDTHWTDTETPSVHEVWYYLARVWSPFLGSFGKNSVGERMITCP